MKPAYPQGSGWFEHFGGTCPVAAHIHVDVVFRDGRRADDWLAKQVIWPHAPKEYPRGHKLWSCEPDAYNDVIWWRRSPSMALLAQAVGEMRADG